MKTTIVAGTDIALIKYWGKKDAALRLPENSSVSVNLAELTTTTTVEFSSAYKQDEVIINGKTEKAEVERVVVQLNRLRSLAAQPKIFARVVSQNNFPTATGLSSSSSGMAALTLAGAEALGLRLSQSELSRLARLASGSACRCVCGGYIEWEAGNSDETSYARTFFPAAHWPLVDVVAIVSRKKKNVSSTAGHQSARTSIFYEARQAHLPAKITQLKTAIEQRNFEELGEIVESEALEFHSILLTSQPPLVLWLPATLAVMHAVRELRHQQVPAYFTMNTGFNVHVFTLSEFQEEVKMVLSKVPGVEEVLVSGIGEGPHEISGHLF